MLKYTLIIAITAVFSFTACQPEETPPPTPEQDQQMQSEALPSDPAPEASVSEEELQLFAEANIEAQEEQINPFQDPEGMEEILEEKDLEPDRFNEIQNAVQQDPQLLQEVNRIIQEELQTEEESSDNF